jgi:hypothetical protein
MKRPHVSLLVALPLSISTLGQAQTADTAESSFKLKPEQTRVMEVTLKPGETKKGEVATKVPVVLGFDTDVFSQKQLTPEKKTEYMKKNIITFDAGAAGSMSSTYGGSTTYEPKGGKIKFSVKNNSDLTVKVLVYTAPGKAP